MYKSRKELRKLAKNQRRSNMAKKAVTTSALALGMGLGLTAIGSNKVDAATWTANSVSSIQSALKTSGTTPYTIKWGDTLSTIVDAANKNGIETSITRLAEINKISNIDLIYAGNKLWFSGQGSNGTVTVTDKDGNNHTYNLSPNKPLNNDGSDNGSSSNGSGNHNNGNNGNSNSGSNGSHNGGNSDNGNGNNSGNSNGSNGGNNNGSGNDDGNNETPEAEKTAYTILLKNKKDGSTIKKEDAEGKVGDSVRFDAEKTIEIDGKKYSIADDSQLSQTITLDKDATKNVITVEYNEDTTAPTEKTSVTVNAVDENGKTIKTDKVDDLNVGDSYTAQAPAIDGYKLNDESSKTITLSKDNNTITFKYVKDSTPVEKTSVTINAVDENGKNIKTDTVNDLNVGDEYTANAPTVDGYKLNDDSTKKITLAQSGNTITFKYVKEDTPVEKTSYTVSYQDEAGNKIKDDKTVSDQVVGSTVKEDAPAIDGYTVKGDASQSLTLKATGNKIVFTYIKNTTHPTPPVPGDGAVGLLDNNGTYNGMTGWDILETYNGGISDWKDKWGNNWHKGFLLFDTAQHANEFGDKYLDDNILNQNSYNGYGYTGVYGKDKTTIIGYALEWKNFGPNNE